MEATLRDERPKWRLEAGPSGAQVALGGQLGRQNGVQVALGGQFEGQVGVQLALGGKLESPSGVQEGLLWRLEASSKAQVASKRRSSCAWNRCTSAPA